MKKTDGLYIQLFSIHGLVRPTNWEMGRNADTGGQVKYVVELAKALGETEGVRKVELFTRKITGKEYSNDYARQKEKINDKASIIRIQCGGSKFIRKELLWHHLDEFVDKTLKYIKESGDMPDIVHGHYADGGYIAGALSAFLGVPFVFTGHSLGRPKKERLSQSGLTEDQMNRQFQIDRRIEEEEKIISSSNLIITSTNQEKEKQYGMYQNGPMASFSVIPPGIDLERFYPFYIDQIPAESQDENLVQAQYYMQKELERFLSNHEKPLILALSRPDRRKNIQGLVKAFGDDKELQAIANLAVFAGIRKDINEMDDNERQVLTDLLLLMDKYDLYGKLAIPKRHDFEYEVPVLYRIVAKSQGVFVNPAFTEPFGLTLIEAAASGLPILATDDGGPRDIIKNCSNGLLVDAHKPEQISKSIKKIVVDPEKWRDFSQNGIEGVKNHYSWEAHCQNYLDDVNKLISPKKLQPAGKENDKAIGRRFTKLNRLFITDIDDTLLGDDNALQEISKLIKENKNNFGFGVATGRPIESAKKVLEEKKVPTPDLFISSVGTEIYYGEQLMPDQGWKRHISAEWRPKKIKKLLDELDYIEMQKEDGEREFKLSYLMEPDPQNMLDLHQLLTEKGIRYNLIYSRQIYLDILPFRASKGKAIRYLSYKWNIPLGNILVSGDTDNDEDMLRGEMMGVVVGNHHEDLEKLRGLRRIYFAKGHYANGIMEGFHHYKFIK